MRHTKRIIIALVCLLALSNTITGQEGAERNPAVTAPVVTATATPDRVRFVAPGTVVQLRLEVFTEAGQKIFDTELRGGNVLDWPLQDGAGERLSSGAYACLLTIKSLSGKLSQRLGQVRVADHEAKVLSVRVTGLSPAQQQSIGPIEGNASFTTLPETGDTALTAVTHNGAEGQLARTRGALSFRVGDFFSGKDREQMRLSEDGNVGIGTDKPEARLDVNGMIRARSGFQFADGSVLDLAPQSGGLRVTLPGGETARVGFAPNAVAATANRLPKFTDAAGTLGDSALYEGANGFIGWGTTTPQHPFAVRRNSATLGIHTIGEFFVDRDNRNRSASLTVGTAGTLKWIFGMPAGGDGFQVYDLTNNASRFFVDPTSGNIGIGTNSPNHKLTIETIGSPLWTNNAWGGAIALSNGAAIGWQRNSANLSFGIGQSSGGLRFFRALDSPGTIIGLPPTYDMAITNEGNVGIGTVAPNAKLFVQGEAANGVGIAATGNAAQSRDKGGWVKAMAYVYSDGTIARCYNGVSGASSGNCGFTVNHFTTGGYGVNFGFYVADRFVSVTAKNCSGCSHFKNFGANWEDAPSGNAINVFTFEADEIESVRDDNFMIIVF